MKMKLEGQRVYVTPKDIYEGDRADPSFCPIARAMTRLLVRTKSYRGCKARVNLSHISIQRNRNGVMKRVAFINLPAKVRDFILNFDSDPSFQVAAARRFNFRLYA